MNETTNTNEQLLAAELTELDAAEPGGKPLFTSNHQRKIVDQVEVQLEAYLGQGHMTIERLFSLTKGDIVALDVAPSEPLELRLNSQLIARGELSVLGEHFAIKITELAD